jgi:hypothetical protein
VEFLRQQQASGQPFRIFATEGLLYPNIATAFRIDDVRSIDPLTPHRYLRYVDLFLSPGAQDRYTGDGQGLARVRDNRWVDLANVRFLVVPADTPQPAQEHLKRAYDGEVDVYENHRAFPRAFLVGSVQSVRDETEAAAALQDPVFDPARTAVVEGGPPDLPTAPPQTPAGEARVVRYEAQRVEIAVDATERSLLVLADTYFPGWGAEVDGQPAPIYPTNLAFRGVVVPPGAHTVVFTYAPQSFSAGLAVAATALLVLVAALVLLTRKTTGEATHPS